MEGAKSNADDAVYHHMRFLSWAVPLQTPRQCLSAAV